MAKLNLWDDFKKWQEGCKVVDLSMIIDDKTQRFGSFPPLELKTMYTVEEHGFLVHLHSVVGQYGTHIDAPAHFVAKARTLEQLPPDEFILPLCVIDKSKEVAANPDFEMTVADIEAWEKEYGKIPADSFVAFRSDWHKRAQQGLDINNPDADGQYHTPGWTLDALKLLYEGRKVKAVGHETLDTDSGLAKTKAGFAGELWLLQIDRYQVEVMINLDQCPAVGGLIFCGVPKIRGAAGFPIRCIAVVPK
ncbi:MAG: cyclase family protein [Deltaproteobacteria bacterium]|jgi:kynurenine formamidase|nr:cyclase family protein [Deltaproteobacteria bacterium]